MQDSLSQCLNSQWLPLDESENGVCDVAGDQVEDKVPAWVQLHAGGEGHEGGGGIRPSMIHVQYCKGLVFL